MISRTNPPLPPLEHACLLLIDPQRLFTDPASPAYVPGWPAAREACGRLARAFAARELPVLRTRHVHPEGDDGGTLARFFPRLQRPDDPWSQVPDDAIPGAEGTPLVDKARLSALSVVEIAELAGRAQVVVLAGVQTHLCLLATAVDAARLGLCPVVVSDATAARPPERHAEALAVLAAGHAYVATTAEVLAALAASGGGLR